MKKFYVFPVLLVFFLTMSFTLSSCNNGAGNEDGNDIGGDTYNIGDTGPGGGIIFYAPPGGFPMADGGRCYYLEVAPSYSGSAEWGDDGTAIAGITTFLTNPIPILDSPESIGNGRKDTQDIVAHMNGKGITGTAAQLCAGSSFGGKNDWFLPSIGELELLYAQWNIEGKPDNYNLAADFYWSSSQFSSGYAWGQGFNGYRNMGTPRKNSPNRVHAIRAF